MKKVTTFAFLLALAIGASAQSAITVRPDAHSVGPTARVSKNATNSTVQVPPVAKPGPVAVPGKKK